MAEPIRGLDGEHVARLYDALHLAWTAARREYLDAEHVAAEEHARGRRDGIDEALSILDEMVDAAGGSRPPRAGAWWSTPPPAT